MANYENPAGAGGSRGRDLALNVGAIAGLICVLAAVASFLFGIKPLIFRSGSMSPDIPTGALALAKTTPAADLQVGDVVSVENQQGTRITHRVHEILSSDGTTSVLVLKGDANIDADLAPYTVTEADRVFASVPGLGYVVSWLSSPAAIFLGGALVGGVMVLAFGPGVKRKDDDDADPGTDSGDVESDEAPQSPPAAYSHAYDAPTESFRTQGFSMRRILPARAVLALGIAGLTAIGATTVGTAAAFTDNATATSTIKSVPNFYPTPLTTDLDCYNKGTAGFRQVEFWWPTVGNTPLGVPYTYQLIVKKGNTIVRNEHVTTAADAGGWHTRSQFRQSDTAQTYRVEIHTVNGANMSTGYAAHNIYIATTSDTYCTGGYSQQANPPFENDIYGGIGPASARVNSLNLSAPSPGRDSSGDTPVTGTTTAPSTTTAAPTSTTTTTAAPPTSTTTTTAAPPTSTTTAAPPTSTTGTTTSTASALPSTTTPSTTTPVPPLAEATTSPSGRYIVGTSSGGVVVRDSAGAEVFSREGSADAEVRWDSTGDTLWIVDDGRIYRVEAGTWRAEVVDPDSGTVPTRVRALVK
ncbi:signal peptidase I [Nocardiaceae bacterium NPDC056970]